MSDDESANHAPDDERPLGRDDRVSLWPLSFEDAIRAPTEDPPIHKRSKDDNV